MNNQYYSSQIERFLAQIIRAFSGFKVRDGVERNGQIHEETIPVVFGTPSRVVAALVSGDVKFSNIKVPIMAVNMTSIEPDDEATINRYHEGELSFREKINETDSEPRAVRRIVGPPLRISVDLIIYADSVSQLMEIFEQIALTFNPEVVIQKSTDAFDQDYIGALRLEGITQGIQNPLGQNARVVEMTLQFTAGVRLSYKDQINGIIKQIIADVKSTDDPNSIESFTIGELDPIPDPTPAP